MSARERTGQINTKPNTRDETLTPGEGGGEGLVLFYNNIWFAPTNETKIKYYFTAVTSDDGRNGVRRRGQEKRQKMKSGICRLQIRNSGRERERESVTVETKRVCTVRAAVERATTTAEKRYGGETR